MKKRLCLVLTLSALALGSWSRVARAQAVKPRFLFVVDTSGSMVWDPQGYGAHGDGSVLHPGCDTNGDGLYNDSRIYQAKAALNDTIAGFGSAEFSLARFHQDTFGQASCVTPGVAPCANGDECVSISGGSYCAIDYYNSASLNYQECAPASSFNLAGSAVLTIGGTNSTIGAPGAASTLVTPTTVAPASLSGSGNTTTNNPTRLQATVTAGLLANDPVIISGCTGPAPQPAGTWLISSVASGTEFRFNSGGAQAAQPLCNWTMPGIGATTGNLIRVRAPAHGFATNDRVEISGVGGATNANGTWTITVVDVNHFTLNGSAMGPAAWTAGTGSITRVGATNTNPIVLSTTAAHGLVTGQSVEVSGVLGNTAANGTFTATVIDATHLSVAATGNGTHTGGGSLRRVTVTNTAPIRIETTAAHNLATGDRVTIAGVGGNTAANGTFLVTVVDATHFTLNGSTGNGTQTSGGTVTYDAATNTSPIRITTTAAHGLATGNSVTIAGVGGNTAANGVWTVTVIDGFRFTLNGSTGNANWTGGGTATVALVGASNTSPIRITTAGTHGYANGQVVVVQGVVGNTAANGRWWITVVNTTQFDLYQDAARTIPVVGNGAYVSGGKVQTGGGGTSGINGCTYCFDTSGTDPVYNFYNNTCTNTPYFFEGDVLVNFPTAGPNFTPLLSWMDGQEDFPIGTNMELRAAGGTPIAGALNSMRDWLQNSASTQGPAGTGGILLSDAKAACRTYSVILITDGEPNCTTNESVEAQNIAAQMLNLCTAGSYWDRVDNRCESLQDGTGVAAGAPLCTTGSTWDPVDARCEDGSGNPSGARLRVKTYVLGFAVNAAALTILNSIASAGGTTSATLVNNQAEMTARLGDIISGSIAVEKCDCLDNTCDGSVDEGYSKGNNCNVGTGRCARGGRMGCNPYFNPAMPVDPVTNPETVCLTNATYNTCSGQVKLCPCGDAPLGSGACPAVPSCKTAEMCNNQDDNCDGATDEGLSCPACIPEICDGLDNDCNAVVDDIPAVSCGLNIGICTPGTTQCVACAGGPGCINGKKAGCVGGTNPLPAELCNNKDDDCDGVTDSFGVQCYTGASGCTFAAGTWTCVGACQTGLKTCVAGSCDGGVTPGCPNNTGPCSGQVVPSGEVACDGIDNDCNGATDEGFGIGNPCGTGACTGGHLTCVSGVVQCTGGGASGPEICDGIDNDCNGLTDDVTGPCGMSNVGECKFGTRTCVACVPGPGCVNGKKETCPGEVDPATETCNNKDDDCNGVIDNPPMAGVGASCGSNVGECRYGTTACVGGAISCQGGVGAQPESCDNKDNDCNGCTDCDMPCLAGLGVLTCPIAGSGLACGSSVGECRPGQLLCLAGSVQCTGQTPPAAELCDNKDNDCDGFTDESDPAIGQSCYPAVAMGCSVALGTCSGECRLGAKQCVAGSGTATITCTGFVTPATEICDGKDNDCNGTTDDGFGVGASCNNGLLGACNKNGSKICNAAGTGTICSAPGATPSPEVCDGIDNDCDGITDNVMGKCGSSIGECRQGDRACVACAGGPGCVNGALETCTGEVKPVTETCDNKDNDCNGVVDNPPMAGIGVACGSSVGECRAGTTACVSGAVVCQGGKGPAASESCNNKDDDCDGCTDCGDPAPGCAAKPCTVPGAGTACGSNVGECTKGGLTCIAGAVSCAGGVQPSSEICDNKDNDCNGFTDESDPALGQACYPAATAGCNVGTGVCVGECKLGGKRCTPDGMGGASLTCDSPVVPTTETCNGKDDDCNGTTDDGFGVGAACDNGLLGACHRTGSKVCNALGTGVVCSAAGATPGVEVCNGIDDDCDGVTDNLAGSCGSGLGECDPGTRKCGDGGEYCDQPKGPKPETCNGKDDDCNGAIDDNVTDPDIVTPTVCGMNVGICRQGVIRCISGGKVCDGGVFPASEVCNNLDDDCDGCTDCGDPSPGCAAKPCTIPGTGVACGSSVGECKPGKLLCIAGATTCSGQSGPFAEVCDGKDNNCNGFKDEDDPLLGTNCYPPATVGCDLGAMACVGECRFGGNLCVSDGMGGAAIACANPVTPKAEVCDGKDNNCDGTTDEGFDVGASCDNGATGMCKKFGVKICNAKGDGTTCSVPPSTPTPEVCNGLDDDCDGVIDNPPLPGVGLPCGSDVGECMAGKTICDGTGKIVCDGATGPTPEVCNGLDDDCDGSTDEDLMPPATSCPPAGVPAGAPLMGECRPGTYKCTGKGGWVCTGSVGPKTEVCNGKDDDCDGITDTAAPCPGSFGCTNGECVPLCGTGEFKCPSDRTCVDGFCIPNPCLKPDIKDNCKPPNFCQLSPDKKSARCKDRCEDVKCPDGTTCEAGACTDCHWPGHECASGQFCGVHTCQPDPCDGVACNAGSYCNDGTCTPSCDAIKCGPSEACRLGKCEVDLCKFSACTSTQYCDPADGTCKPNPCGLVSCMLGERCVPMTGNCDPDPCLKLRCTGADVCKVYSDGRAECASDQTQPPPRKTDVSGSGGGGCLCATAASPRALGAGAPPSLGLALGLALAAARRRGRGRGGRR